MTLHKFGFDGSGSSICRFAAMFGLDSMVKYVLDPLSMASRVIFHANCNLMKDLSTDHLHISSQKYLSKFLYFDLHYL